MLVHLFVVSCCYRAGQNGSYKSLLITIPFYVLEAVYLLVFLTDCEYTNECFHQGQTIISITIIISFISVHLRLRRHSLKLYHQLRYTIWTRKARHRLCHTLTDQVVLFRQTFSFLKGHHVTSASHSNIVMIHSKKSECDIYFESLNKSWN